MSSSYSLLRNTLKGFMYLAVLIIAVISFSSFKSCTSAKTVKTPDVNITNMEYDNYENMWKEFIKFSNDGKFRDALAFLKTIEERAISDKNDEQLLKVWFHMFQTNSNISEDPYIDHITYVQDNFKNLHSPAGVSIGYSYLAELYDNYLRRNQYKLRNLTNVEGDLPEDIQEWSMKQLIEKVSELYFKSLEDDQVISIANNSFNAIIDNLTSDGSTLRPTIYDLLVQRAINHFNSQYALLTEPVQSFVFDQESAFASSSAFISTKFPEVDPNSKLYNILRVYQKIESLHAEGTSPKIDYVIKRLKFAYDNSVANNKETLYINGLNNILDKFKGQEATFHAAQYVIQYYISKASISEVGKKDNNNVIALEKINQFLDVYKNKRNQEILSAFKESILRPEIKLNAELVYPPTYDFPVFLEFRNIESAKILFYKLSFTDLQVFYSENKPENFIRKNSLVATEIVELPTTSDYNSHTTEVVIAAKPIGAYLMVIEDEDSRIQYSQLVHISDIGYANVNREYIQVANRSTGKPIDVIVDLYKYSWNGRKRNINKVASIQTDEFGKLRLPGNRESYLLDVQNNEDRLFLNNNQSISSRNLYDQPKSIFTFTDRAIYRPGQKIYYKSIVTEQLIGSDPKIVSNENLTVILRDANYQVVEEIKMNTNEFGSINGSFTLPKNLLNGRFTLEVLANNNVRSNSSIQVEEYKRPTFQVEILPITESYKLNEKVQISGTAKTFSGVSLQNAKVIYKIVRTKPYKYYYRYYNPVPEKMIATGQSITDEKGDFSIEFIAESPADNTNDHALYNYEIDVQVVDISGESQSTTKNISAGKYAYEIFTLKDHVFENAKDTKINIDFKNLNGEMAKGEIQLQIEKLKSPSNYLKSKYWTTPEFQLITKEEYYLRTSNYPYKEEHEIENWEVEQQVANEKLQINGTFEYVNQYLSPGIYRMIMESKDAAKSVSYIEVIGNEKAKGKNLLHLSTDKENYKSGEVLQVKLTSAVPNLSVFYDVERVISSENRKVLTLNTTNSQSHPLSNSDRGGILVHASGFYDNRYFQQQISKDIPYADKSLSLEWETFRSDLLPGIEEKWRLKIKDNSGKPVDAEILSSMYDASLDDFISHAWNGLRFKKLNKNIYIVPIGFQNGYSKLLKNINGSYPAVYEYVYPYINTLITQNGYGIRTLRKSAMRGEMPMSAPMEADMMMESEESAFADGAAMDDSSNKKRESADEPHVDKSSEKEIVDQPLRTNLDETVFFMPALRTNESGETIIEFTMNEALTEWKLQTFAHTKSSQFVLDKQTVKTAKDLMVFPTGPRFFREGDRMQIPTKINNLTDGKLLAQASVQFIDAITQKDITSLVIQGDSKKQVTIEAENSAVVNWTIKVPKDITSITYRIIAKAGDHTDGEEKTAIVLSNRKLVTESLAITVPANSTKKVEVPSFAKLQSESAEAKLYQITVTSNPSWLAVQSLPYLMEYPYKCSEQVFARYFANQLGAHILIQNPAIEDIYAEWKDKDQLISALRKNEELKSAILQQTPWVLDAISEEEQMERMAFLFDMQRIKVESSADLQTLLDRQNGGGFPWFPGGRPNWYITQHIIEGMGQLIKMGVVSGENTQIRNMVQQALAFADQEFIEYDRKSNSKRYISPLVVHYMYTHSFFPEIEPSKKAQAILKEYIKLAKEDWLSLGILNQGQLALYFHRENETEWSEKIIESLRQRTIYKPNLGRYWKEVNGYMWHQSNIESQAMMISAFHEIAGKDDEIDEMKMWLLSNKQTNRWKSTKATTQAVYSIVETGGKWINNDQVVTVVAAGNAVKVPQESIVAATGQYDVKYRDTEIVKELANVEFKNPNAHTAWASTSFQYFEDLDKIESYQNTPLQLKRNYFKKIVTDSGEKLEAIEGKSIRPGDVITVRLSLIVDRPMEFIHLQDMRAAGTEPVDVISAYKWDGGLSYYMETRDAATNFFVDYLPRGEYMLEYDQRAVQVGTYSAGVSTIQSMYAPEFGANSAGKTITVD